MVQYPACSSSPATTAEQDRPLPWRDGRRIGEGGRVPRGAPGRAGALLRRRYVLPCLPPVGSSTYMTGGTVFFTLRKLESEMGGGGRSKQHSSPVQVVHASWPVALNNDESSVVVVN